MVVYFSGSISGGREDVALYQAIVDRLRAAGIEVVAGEVVNPNLHDKGEGLSDEAIFARDLGWLEDVARRNGALVAEVSRPSLGVGYEIATARYRLGTPVICLYREGHTRRCSAMISGDPGIQLIRYSEEELPQAIERLLGMLGAIVNKTDPSSVSRLDAAGPD